MTESVMVNMGMRDKNTVNQFVGMGIEALYVRKYFLTYQFINGKELELAKIKLGTILFNQRHSNIQDDSGGISPYFNAGTAYFLCASVDFEMHKF
jgi:hypothetical protein